MTKYQMWLHLKNCLGKRIPEQKKVVVFLVDDYGNVRLDSASARDSLQRQGHIDGQNRFDLYDALETKDDLSELYDVLSSVKDKLDKPAVFTPMALSANIDFAAIREHGFDRYRYETVAQTFNRKAQEDPAIYEGAWELVQEGIRSGIFLPQFHGREHLNVVAFEQLLQNRYPKLMDCIEQCSLVGGDYSTGSSLLTAFDFAGFIDKKEHGNIIHDGIQVFKQSFGYEPVLFTSPGAYAYSGIEPLLANSGIKGIDTYFIGIEHLGDGQYKRRWHFHGQKNSDGQVYILRNVVFEPTAVQNEALEIDKALQEIAIAFRWNKPAIISSHRVNFCGHISPENRARGLSALKTLLQQIVKRWPDVEFWDGGSLVNEMIRSHES